MERIEVLVDSGSFCEVGSRVQHHCADFGMDRMELPYDGVITGFGTVFGRQVAVYSQDFSVMAGTLGEMHGRKIARIIELAIASRCPLIGMNDSGGARIQEGIHSLAGYGDIFRLNTEASGYVPQISVILGPCAGGAVYSPGITDFVFMVKHSSHMFVTGPKVVKEVLFEDVDSETLGGPRLHAEESGVAHFVIDGEAECLGHVRQLLQYLPQYWNEPRNAVPKLDSDVPDGDGVNGSRSGGEPSRVIPESSRRPYDIRQIVMGIFDKGTFFEIAELFARNIVIGLARLNGLVVGVVANQPEVLAGVLDADASDKAARFVRFCDAFEIPIVTLVDVPGFMPGFEQEQKGIIRHGAKLLYAYAEATVPKISVIVRKAYGGAYIAMCSKQLGADFVYAWPKAEIAVMGAEAAVEVLHKRGMRAAPDPVAYREEKARDYAEHFLNPSIAARWGIVDEVIAPEMTRHYIISSLRQLAAKAERSIKKKHGNIPL